MLNVKLYNTQDPSIIEEQNTKIQLITYESFSSTRKNVTKGKWYYECTYYEGTGNFLAGFSTQYGMIQYYYYHNSKHHVWLNDNFVNDQNIYDINYSFPNENYTIGVGIDIDLSYFYIFLNHSIEAFQYKKQPPDSAYNIVVRGASSPTDIFNETVSVNFGGKPFLNDYGFPSWNSLQKFPTCFVRCKIKPTFNLIYVFLL